MTPPMTRGARVALASLAAAALATGAVSTTATAAEPRASSAPSAAAEKGKLKKAARGDKLGSHDRTLLAQARATGEKRVTVMLATTKGSAAAVAVRIHRLKALLAEPYRAEEKSA